MFLSKYKPLFQKFKNSLKTEIAFAGTICSMGQGKLSSSAGSSQLHGKSPVLPASHPVSDCFQDFDQPVFSNNDNFQRQWHEKAASLSDCVGALISLDMQMSIVLLELNTLSHSPEFKRLLKKEGL